MGHFLHLGSMCLCHDEGPDKATSGGVNGSQSKFLMELSLCPRLTQHTFLLT
jgi:hypothetical protein